MNTLVTASWINFILEKIINRPSERGGGVSNNTAHCERAFTTNPAFYLSKMFKNIFLSNIAKFEYSKTKNYFNYNVLLSTSISTGILKCHINDLMTSSQQIQIFFFYFWHHWCVICIVMLRVFHLCTPSSKITIAYRL